MVQNYLSLTGVKSLRVSFTVCRPPVAAPSKVAPAVLTPNPKVRVPSSVPFKTKEASTSLVTYKNSSPLIATVPLCGSKTGLSLPDHG